jgi:radical SAM superfamily enzyme YgiQ (UPF0313 family)
MKGNKMKIFIGNPPLEKKKVPKLRWSFEESKDSKYLPFPFYLAYTSSLLKSKGHEVLFLDGMALELTKSEFIQLANRFNPDFTVIETSQHSFNEDIIISKMMVGKKIFTGFYVSMHPEVVKNPNIDYITKGEYEFKVLDIIEGRKQRNGLANIDSFPFPDRDNQPEYYEGSCYYPRSMAWLWASRGCPYSCKFCTVPKFYGTRKRRQRSVKNVMEEIDKLMGTGKYHFYYFDDDDFNLNRKWLEQFSKEIKTRKIEWGAMCRGDVNTDLEILKKMKNSGCYGLRFGIESGNQSIVNNIGKKLDLDKTRQAIKNCKRFGIKTHLTFIFGLPGETWDTIEDTKEFLIETNPTTAQLTLVHHYEGVNMDFSEIKPELGKKGIDYCMKKWKRHKIIHNPLGYINRRFRK